MNTKLCKKLRRATREALGHGHSGTHLQEFEGLHVFGWKTDPNTLRRIPDLRSIRWATVRRTGFRALYQDMKKAAEKLRLSGVRRQEDRVLHPRLAVRPEQQPPG
jgi:hypothetical protein